MPRTDKAYSITPVSVIIATSNRDDTRERGVEAANGDVRPKEKTMAFPLNSRRFSISAGRSGEQFSERNDLNTAIAHGAYVLRVWMEVVAELFAVIEVSLKRFKIFAPDTQLGRNASL